VADTDQEATQGMTGRRTPYTERGIRRMKCMRCGQPAVHQWQICADGNTYRPICASCDIELNEMVLRFVHDPEWQQKMIQYAEAQR
jgi:transposase-like protein